MDRQYIEERLAKLRATREALAAQLNGVLGGINELSNLLAEMDAAEKEPVAKEE